MVLCGRGSGVGGPISHGALADGLDFLRPEIGTWHALFGGGCSAATGLALPVTIRMSARIAGFAILAAEATAVGTRADRLPTLVVWTVLVALQFVAVVWATDPRSAVVLRMVAPAGLTAVTVAAVWTALALAVPPIATGNAVALVAIVAVGLVVVAWSRRGAGQRLLPLVLIASAGSALLIFLAISWVLPTIPGYVSHNHPPTYTDVTRLVDPIGEFAIFVVLALALGIEVLRARSRPRRTAAREQRPTHVAAPNEMVVEPDV